MYLELNCTTYIEKYHFSLLSNGFHGVFSYTEQQDKQQRKDQDGYESSIRGYQLTDGTGHHQIQEKYKWQNLNSRLERRRGHFTIIHVKATNKVTSILKLGKKNSFIGLQNLEAKEIVQKSQVCHFKFLLKSSFHMV
jgi:hypothetical protein